MADPKISVSIKGLAFCRPINPTGADPRGQFQVLFLHPDNQHVINLRIEQQFGSSPPYVITDTLPVKSLLRITAGASVTSQLPSGTSRLDLVNIFELHDISESTVELKPNPIIARSVMVIPSSRFYSKTLTKRFHEYWVYDKVSTPHRKTLIDATMTQRPRRLIGQEIGVEFSVPTGNEFKLELTVAPAVTVTKTYPLPMLPDVAYKIQVDNTCHEHSCGNDFAYYYEILDGGGKEIEEFPIVPAVTGTPSESLEAACNPVWGSPDCDLEYYYLHGTCGPAR